MRDRENVIEPSGIPFHEYYFRSLSGAEMNAQRNVRPWERDWWVNEKSPELRALLKSLFSRDVVAFRLTPHTSCLSLVAFRLTPHTSRFSLFAFRFSLFAWLFALPFNKVSNLRHPFIRIGFHSGISDIFFNDRGNVLNVVGFDVGIHRGMCIAYAMITSHIFHH